jgi:hypothetical protein
MLTLKNQTALYTPISKEYLQNADKRDAMYSELKKMFRADYIDYSVKRLDFLEAQKLFERSSKKLRAILRVNRANTTYKKIDAKQRRALEREPCVICYETHDAKHLTTTNCGHTFCRPCFSKILDTCYYDIKEVSCPLLPK